MDKPENSLESPLPGKTCSNKIAEEPLQLFQTIGR